MARTLLHAPVAYWRPITVCEPASYVRGEYGQVDEEPHASNLPRRRLRREGPIRPRLPPLIGLQGIIHYSARAKYVKRARSVLEQRARRRRLSTGPR